MTKQSQSSIGSKFFQEGDILTKTLGNSKFSKKRRERKMKRSQEGTCSMSYPSGNQVDGLPLVAIKNSRKIGNRNSRRPRTQILLTMINMFLNVISLRKCLLISIISQSYIEASYNDRL